MDIVSKEARLRIMASIRSKNTKPERVVRSMLRRMGFCFRLHRADLPGRPDIVLPKHRKVIFVHGCFWHQHRSCPLASSPGTNIEYWKPKLAGNVQRDMRNRRRLRKLGWASLAVWECQMRDAERLKKIRVCKFGD
jgi:DNA mismatch endonuclease (patch repair protein)